MTEPNPLTDIVSTSINEIAVKPAFGSRLSIEIRQYGSYGNRQVPGTVAAVTIHGDGRIEYHPDPLEPVETEQATADTTASDGAWHTVWLEGNWKWTTRKMTTAQREHAAAAVERYSAEQGDPDDDPINVRWWDE